MDIEIIHAEVLILLPRNYGSFPLPLQHIFTTIVGLGLLSRRFPNHIHLDTPHWAGLIWTRNRPVAETSTWQHTTLTRDRHQCSRQHSNPQSQQAIGRRHSSYDCTATGIGPSRYTAVENVQKQNTDNKLLKIRPTNAPVVYLFSLIYLHLHILLVHLLVF